YSGKYKVAPGADLSLTTATGNLYFDIPTSMAITPYLGAGVGYSWGSVSGGGSNKNGLTAALMAGLGVNLSDNMTLDVGYRFVDVFATGSNPKEHQVLVGLRYQF
ncbi:MAG: outer membrane beta-barrel protein, partial [Rhizobiales bacterium]|nr:outer membrane beta-barrel protein [Hyphomicrobiales bacterium]